MSMEFPVSYVGEGVRYSVPEAHWEAFRARLMREGLPQRQVPFFEGRVCQWLDSDLEVPPGADPARHFAQWLEANQVPDWQCRQAYQAVQLWLKLEAERAATVKAALPPAAAPAQLQSWPQILETMGQRLCSQRYSVRTQETYLDWARRFARDNPHVPRDPEEASEAAQTFMRKMAIGRNLSPASLSQARNALAWLIRRVMGFDLVLEPKGDAHRGRRLPKILAPERVRDLLKACEAPWDLFFGLQYGCGLRLMEALDLRVQEVDLDRGVLNVRHGKGDKDRQLPLPNAIRAHLVAHLEKRKLQWERDVVAGIAKVDLPHALSAKFSKDSTSWEWQHVFGSNRPLRYPETGELRRWRPMESLVRDALKEAALAAGLDGRVHPHLLRHCYATHLLEAGMPIKQIQELMGHARLETTMVYMHVRSPVASMRSPLDML
jgi:integron integrase